MTSCKNIFNQFLCFEDEICRRTLDLNGLTGLEVGDLPSTLDFCLILQVALGGGFKDFLFSPLFGEDEPVLTSIFFNGVETTK